MRASLIVCTRDRARLLERLFGALAAQRPAIPDFEVVVVDDQSRDETAEVCRRWRELLPRLSVIRLENHAGLSAAANRGLAAARGECLLFTDDDCIPEPDWVARMLEALQTAPIVSGAIRSPTGNYFQLCHNIAQFHTFLVPGPARRRLQFIAGANLGVQRRVMEACGGFDETTPISDMEWLLRARRRGFGVAFGAEAVVVHAPPRQSLAALLRYASAHAFHTIRLRQVHRDLLRTPWPLRHQLGVLLGAPLIALGTTARIYLGNRRLWRHPATAPVVFLTKLAWCWGAARGLRGHDRKE